jgi:hypothetical protein
MAWHGIDIDMANRMTTATIRDVIFARGLDHFTR